MAVIQFPRASALEVRRVQVGGEEVAFPWPLLVSGRTFDGDLYEAVSFSGTPTVELESSAQARLERWPSSWPQDVHLVLRRHSCEASALAYLTALHDAGRPYPELEACSLSQHGSYWFTMALRRVQSDLPGGGLIFVVEVERRMVALRDSVMVDLGPYRIDEVTFQSSDGSLHFGEVAGELSGFVPTCE